MATPDDILSWTSMDPRESQLFNSWGVLYRFQVRQSAFNRHLLRLPSIMQIYFLISRRSSTQTGRALRRSCEWSDRIRKTALQNLNGPQTADLVASLSARSAWFCHLSVLEADSNLINQNMLPMADMVRPDPAIQVCHLLSMHYYKATNVSRGRPCF